MPSSLKYTPRLSFTFTFFLSPNPAGPPHRLPPRHLESPVAQLPGAGPGAGHRRSTWPPRRHFREGGPGPGGGADLVPNRGTEACAGSQSASVDAFLAMRRQDEVASFAVARPVPAAPGIYIYIYISLCPSDVRPMSVRCPSASGYVFS
jgi:hypothetical protein